MEALRSRQNESSTEIQGEDELGDLSHVIAKHRRRVTLGRGAVQ